MQHASKLYMSSPWCDLSETEFDTSVLHEDTGMPYAVFFKHAIPGCPVICCPAVAVFAPGPAHKQEHSQLKLVRLFMNVTFALSEPLCNRHWKDHLACKSRVKSPILQVSASASSADVEL